VVAARQLGQRHRRVDVVEAGGATRMGLHEAAHRDAIGHVGADHHRVGAGDLAAPVLQCREAVVEFEAAEIGVGQVAVRGIPGHVAFQEQHLVPARGEGGEQRPEGGRMAVAPGGGQAETEDDQLHASAPSEPIVARPSTRSTSAARSS
jgi:hypothetical protein